MARKPVLEGGKRDEIINAAAALFFREGFEKTSIRKILNEVNGEIGMFYHYFKSKEELFDIAVDRFFRQYETAFREMAQDIDSVETFTDKFLALYASSMEKYRVAEGQMHWTIKSALHERTLVALIPAAAELLQKFGYQGFYPLDIAAAKATADISAAIHSASFANMNQTQKKELIGHLIHDILER